VILEKEGPTQVSDLLKKLDMNNEADIPIFVESLHQLQQAGLVEYDGEHEVVLLTSTGGKVVKLLSEVG
jgi:Mn-dependent DtxR family transcriptional regulator